MMAGMCVGLWQDYILPAKGCYLWGLKTHTHTHTHTRGRVGLFVGTHTVGGGLVCVYLDSNRVATFGA